VSVFSFHNIFIPIFILFTQVLLLSGYPYDRVYLFDLVVSASEPYLASSKVLLVSAEIDSGLWRDWRLANRRQLKWIKLWFLPSHHRTSLSWKQHLLTFYVGNDSRSMVAESPTYKILVPRNPGGRGPTRKDQN